MNYRFRTGELGELILQVEGPSEPQGCGRFVASWRDAKVEDLPIWDWIGENKAAEQHQCDDTVRRMEFPTFDASNPR